MILPPPVLLTLKPDPTPTRWFRHAILLPDGQLLDHGRTLAHAEAWREGWNARLDLRSQRSGPREHHLGYADWHRGWRAANRYERERAERTAQREAA